jgi:hypothetical protein
MNRKERIFVPHAARNGGDEAFISVDKWLQTTAHQMNIG